MPHPDSDAYVALLPHRPPFRFVDSVDQVVPASYIEARYRVTGDEEFLSGHFPGNPVFPGVLQLEALAQAGAITLLCDGRYEGKLALFGGVEKVRFRRIVRPGDEMLLVVRDREAERARRLGQGEGIRRRRNRLRSENALRRDLTIRRSLRAGIPGSRPFAPGERLARVARLGAPQVAVRACAARGIVLGLVLVELAELAEVAGLAAVDVGEVGDAGRGHLAGHFLGVRAVEEQAGLHVAVERRFVAHAPPRGDDDQHEEEDGCHSDDHEHRRRELERETSGHPRIIAAARRWSDHAGALREEFVAGRRMALLLAVVTACVLVPVAPAGAAPLPNSWCGPDESPKDRPDLIVGKQVHVVYAYPTDSADRFGDMARTIVRDLAGVDTWWRSQDPLRTPRFDLAAFPDCTTEFGNVDVSSVPLTFDSSVYDPDGGSDFTLRVGDDLTANGLSDDQQEVPRVLRRPRGRRHLRSLREQPDHRRPDASVVRLPPGLIPDVASAGTERETGGRRAPPRTNCSTP